MAWAQLKLKKIYSIQDLRLWLHPSTEIINIGRAQAKKLFSGKTSVMYYHETVKCVQVTKREQGNCAGPSQKDFLTFIFSYFCTTICSYVSMLVYCNAWSLICQHQLERWCSTLHNSVLCEWIINRTEHIQQSNMRNRKSKPPYRCSPSTSKVYSLMLQGQHS